MRVFLSYRRDDAAPWAGRLRDALAARFGDDTIDDAIERCDAVIAVIGPRWVSVVDEQGEPRLARADDAVRRELEAALARTTPTIPVLVGGARLPDVTHVPAALQPLMLRQAVELRDESWHDDVERLVRSLHGPSTSRSAGVPPKRLATATIALVVAAVVIGGVLLLRDGTGWWRP